MSKDVGPDIIETVAITTQKKSNVKTKSAVVESASSPPSDLTL